MTPATPSPSLTRCLATAWASCLEERDGNDVFIISLSCLQCMSLVSGGRPGRRAHGWAVFRPSYIFITFCSGQSQKTASPMYSLFHHFMDLFQLFLGTVWCLFSMSVLAVVIVSFQRLHQVHFFKMLFWHLTFRMFRSICCWMFGMFLSLL